MKIQYRVVTKDDMVVEAQAEVDGETVTVKKQRTVVQLVPVTGGHGTVKLELPAADAVGFEVDAVMDADFTPSV